MNCETCGGTGEIPLLGPNTTDCPDCEDSDRSGILKWEVVSDHDLFFHDGSLHITAEAGGVVAVDFKNNLVAYTTPDATARFAGSLDDEEAPEAEEWEKLFDDFQSFARVT